MKLVPLLFTVTLLCGSALGTAQDGVVARTDASSRLVELPFEDPLQFPDSAYQIMAKARVVWLGEMHGTKESPMLFRGLVRLIARRDRPPVVALEIPAADQAAVDHYMASGDETLLRSLTFFGGDFRDGRSSQAMVNLVEALRTEKIGKLVCFDPGSATSDEGREEKMAANLAKCVEEWPQAKVVVLSGNVHSSIAVGAPWDSNYRPAAFVLSKTISPVLTFKLCYEGGTVWALMDSGAGEHRVYGRSWSGKTPYYISFDPIPTNGHCGVIFSRTVSASPPWQ